MDLKLRLNDKPLEVYPSQHDVIEDPARFKLIEAGRRWGKTITLLIWLIQQSLIRRGEMFWYVAPQYNQAHDIAWDILMDMLPDDAKEHVDNRKLTVTFPWRSPGGRQTKLALKGSDKPDSLRGKRLGAAGMDEAAFQKSFIHRRIIEPMLADLQAPMMAVSSPKVGWFTKLVDKARENAPGYADFKAWHYTIYDNPFISRTEIERIKASTPDHEWEQEYMARRVDFSGVVYPEFDEAVHVIGRGQHYRDTSSYKHLLGIDWGSDDPTGVTWGAVLPQEYDEPVNGIYLPRGGIVTYDEHVQNGWDPDRHCDLINRKSERMGWQLSHDNTVLDQANFRKESKGKDSIAKEFSRYLGFNPSRSVKNKDVGVSNVKLMLRNNWVQISGKCRSLIAALRDHEWGEHEPDVLAAWRYMLTHAIQRRFTRLIEAKDIKGARRIIPTSSKHQPLDRLEKPGTKNRKKGRFGWDRSTGTPIIKRRLIG